MKNTWHADRQEKVGPHSKLPADHPVSKRLAAAGMGVKGDVECKGNREHNAVGAEW